MKRNLFKFKEAVEEQGKLAMYDISEKYTSGLIVYKKKYSSGITSKLGGASLGGVFQLGNDQTFSYYSSLKDELHGHFIRFGASKNYAYSVEDYGLALFSTWVGKDGVVVQNSLIDIKKDNWKTLYQEHPEYFKVIEEFYSDMEADNGARALCADFLYTKPLSLDLSYKLFWAYNRKQISQNHEIDNSAFLIYDLLMSYRKTLADVNAQSLLPSCDNTCIIKFDYAPLLPQLTCNITLREIGKETKANSVSELVDYPYLPAISFEKEVDIAMRTITNFADNIDLIVCEGYGHTHPSGVGTASAIGIELNTPSIGFMINSGDEMAPGAELNRKAFWAGELIVQTFSLSKSDSFVHLSPGYLIDRDMLPSIFNELQGHFEELAIERSLLGKSEVYFPAFNPMVKDEVFFERNNLV